MRSIILSLIFCVAVINCQKNEALRLIAFNETDTQWLPISVIEKLMINKVNFIDITDHQNVPVRNAYVNADPLPTQPIHKIYVIQELFPDLDVTQLQNNLNTLTTFNTRYYTSTTGQQAAKWIHDKFAEYISTNKDRTDITVELFTHTWVQPSVIATIPGRGPNKDQIVIIGAHEDSVGSSSTGRSPGADDDGSGTVSVLEIFRVLVQNNYHPDRTVKFMTYAGEEAGLLGSQAIASKYSADKAQVHGVLQLDMVGYGGETEIGVVTDFTDANLTEFSKILIDAYSLLPWTTTRCGYGCSDHASWNRFGYRAIFPFETVFSRSNPYIHTQNDVVSHLSFDRIAEFCKLGLGFVVEMADITISP